MKKEIYNIGILGCANIAIRSLIPTFANNERLHVEAIASRSIEKAKEVAEKYKCKAYGSYEELIADKNIDIIYMPLPNALHYKYGKLALQMGKHMLIEKSLCCSYSEVVELVCIAREKNLLLLENFQFRFHSQTKWVKNIIDTGKLGKIRCFRSSFGFPPFSDSKNIRYSKELGGGALLDAGAYTVKSMNVFFPNEKFKHKTSTMLTPKGYEVDIYGGAYFDSNNGIIAQLAYGFDNFYQCGFEIWGSKGKLTSTRAYTAPTNLQPKIIIETAQDGVKEYMLETCDHFMEMTKYMVNCIDMKDFDNDYEQNLLQAKQLEEIREYEQKTS